MAPAKRLRWITNAFVDFETKNQYHVPGAQTQSSWMAILIGTFAAVGGFLYGYDTGLSNNVLSMDYVIENFSNNGVSFSPSERAIATASLSLGTLFGSIVSPLLSDTIGRKMAILFASLVVFNIGNICQVASTGSALLCVGRSITGCAIGVLSAVVPLYQSEASPKWVRGAIVSTYQWAITWGFLCSSAISQGTYHMQNLGSYRIPIGLQSGWALILSVGVLFLPESPRFFVMKDRIPEAAHSLSTLRRVPEDDPGLVEELVDIKATHDYAVALSSYSYIDCFRSDRGRSKQGLRMMTGIILQAMQQATGINFIFYYGVWFFVKTGVVNQPYLYSFLTYAVNVVGTIPGIVLIELIGRRNSLVYGGLGMSVSTFIIAIVGTVQPNSSTTNKVMLAFVCCFIVCFACTWGPGVWVITSEIFPLGVRGRAVSLSTATNWLFNFGFAFLSPYLIGGDTDSTISLGNRIFFLWGSLSLAGTIFAYFAVYETKGLRLEEIDEMYRTCKNAMLSRNFVRGDKYYGQNSDQLRYNIVTEVNRYNDHFNGTRNVTDQNKSNNTLHSTPSNNPDKQKYMDIIQTQKRDPNSYDFEKNITSSSDGSTTVRTNFAAAGPGSTNANTNFHPHQLLNLGTESATINRTSTTNELSHSYTNIGSVSTGNHHNDHDKTQAATSNTQATTNIDNHSGTNHNQSSTNNNTNDNMSIDLGYGFQLSNNLYLNGAPSISTSSSDSVSSMLDMNLQSNDLREYVNNLQSRQHQQQVRTDSHTSEPYNHSNNSSSNASQSFLASYLNSAYISMNNNNHNQASVTTPNNDTSLMSVAGSGTAQDQAMNNFNHPQENDVESASSYSSSEMT